MKKLLLALALLASLLLGRAGADQPTCDFDFGSLLYGPPAGDDQLTTLAVDSVGGNNANAGTLYAPKLTLPQTVSQGEVIGLYRGSFFRDSLSFTALGTTDGTVVQGVALGSLNALPVISALDPVPDAGFVSNGDGTYAYTWTGEDTLSNDGYNNVYVVEINTTTEAASPVASRRRMTDAATLAAVAGSPAASGKGSVYVQSLGNNQWKATLQPSDSLAPGGGVYRYEVVSRVQPVDFGGSATNPGDGALSGVELVGGGSGYGALTGPPGFAGDRLAFVHATSHNAVVGGGSLQRSVFYESGNQTSGSIQLAWYAGTGTGLRWTLDDCLFYANVGDRAANCLIAHTGGSSSYDRGDLARCAFLGARWSDSSLQGTAIDYANVATGVIEGVYVFGIRNTFGYNMPASTEVKGSVFQAVWRTLIAGSFHDNILECEGATNAVDPGYAVPCGFLFHQNGASVVNNLFWAHGLAAAASDHQAVGFNFDTGVTSGTAQRNILVLDPATPATQASYTQGLPASLGGVSVDYNLVICTGRFAAPNPSGNAFTSWAAYQAGYPALDAHSLFVDLSNDPRGLGAVFLNPANGDFRWAQTDVARRCAAYCAANNVGPATVTTHWPLVPTVDAAVRLLTDL